MITGNLEDVGDCDQDVLLICTLLPCDPVNKAMMQPSITPCDPKRPIVPCHLLLDRVASSEHAVNLCQII